MTTFSIGVLAPRAGLWSVSVTTAWPGFIVCGALSLCHCSLAFPLNFDIHHQLCGHMCTWWLSDEKVARFHIQVWHIEEWKDARGVLVGKDSDIRTQTLSLSLSFSLSLSLWYAHIRTQLLVSSTDEFWENKQLQEEERTIRLDGLPNFIIYYGLPEMHTLLQPGACLRFTCNCKSTHTHTRTHTHTLYMHAHLYNQTCSISNPLIWQNQDIEGWTENSLLYTLTHKTGYHLSLIISLVSKSEQSLCFSNK